jgi:methyltransferase (TIGR00027 family)
MRLPNLSYMVTVGELRYIQSRFETARYRNPDCVVGDFLQLTTRLRCAVRGKFFLSRLRTKPFYAYVVHRTKYYDDVFLDAVYGSFNAIINIGCGSDTRAYRFSHVLKQKGVGVVECDQPLAISQKEAIARLRWPTEHVEYASLDLNAAEWPAFETLLARKAGGRVLVLMEGVSPYVREDSFRAFLAFLAAKLHQGSVLAYDFKLRGVADDFGSSGQGQRLFRLSADRQEIDGFHAPLGYRLQHVETSTELARRLDPQSEAPFEEDCLVRLVTGR